ncbi:MAG: hypothetical protein KF886_09390 [Candidatus Hydrogenedentes bacterium]|nr:hypothetical protein [Candidatus Hydrogenedentota bacterium]
MPSQRESGSVHPGINWGPFTTRIPFIHTRFEWQDLVQGIFVAGATGLATVPILTHYLGLSFEEAVACMFIQSLILCSAPILFGEPFAPGMVTPALPLMLLAISGPDMATPEDRLHFLTAASINLAIILFVLGITGLGSRFIEWIPPALKGGIILGAAIAALKRVFLDDADKLIHATPITTTAALVVCMLLIFSEPVQRYKKQMRWLALLASLGLLPGFFTAALIGPLTGFFREGPAEVIYEIEWGVLWLPFGAVIQRMSPFSIGFPDPAMFLKALPLALMSYVILFGDIITGSEIIKAAQKARPDEHIDINSNRSHLALAIRNAVMALVAPFFPYQGALWTGVQVVIVQRWTDGRKSMDSLFSGIHSYYVFGIPVLYFCLPLVTALKPLMGVALSLTLVLTGFACAFVAMAIPRTTIERGVVLLTAVALAIFNPWVGMSVGIAATFLLVGWQRPAEENSA